ELSRARCVGSGRVLREVVARRLPRLVLVPRELPCLYQTACGLGSQAAPRVRFDVLREPLGCRMIPVPEVRLYKTEPVDRTVEPGLAAAGLDVGLLGAVGVVREARRVPQQDQLRRIEAHAQRAEPDALGGGQRLAIASGVGELDPGA